MIFRMGEFAPAGLDEYPVTPVTLRQEIEC